MKESQEPIAGQLGKSEFRGWGIVSILLILIPKLLNRVQGLSLGLISFASKK